VPRRPDLPPLAEEDHSCAACGLDYSAVATAQAVDTVAGLADRYRAAVDAVPVDDRGARPAAEVWSVAEYVCHVRDVFVASTIRLYRVRVEDEPAVEPLFNDLRAARFGYARRDLGPVLDELADAVAGFVAEVSRVAHPDGWDRVCTRLPHERRTARWLVRQALHEGVHHLADVEQVAVHVRERLGGGEPTRTACSGDRAEGTS
jgi:hypothetical protein